MHWRIALFLALLSLVPVQIASAQPSVPATFYGSVTVNGQAAPTGSEVRGFIDGLDCTQSAPGERPAIREGNATAYVIAVVHDSQRPGCGRPGVAVTFTVDGELAAQRATWQAGPIQVDLSVGPGDIVPLPTATATVPGPVPTSTNLPSEPTTHPGSPPTDDVTLPGTPFPGTPGGNGGLVSGAGAEPGSTAGSDSLLPLVLALLAILLIVGGAGGYALSRKRNSA
ncbi:MAG TPA: hypothetical protein PKD27_06590 [Tepidiformaceae bacterium]|nr:hypothetical protein [Tepidiformaceae bacterium]